MIVLRGIRFESHCEHHMAPILGRAWVGYMPGDRVVGISKLARVVESFAKRLQIQEKLTAQIANTINDALKPNPFRGTLSWVADRASLYGRSSHLARSGETLAAISKSYGVSIAMISRL